MENYKIPCIIYDSNCTMCKRFKEALERMDTNKVYSFYSIHDESLYEAFPFLSKEACHEKVHLVESPDRVYQGGDIILALKNEIPLINKISWLLDHEASMKAINFFYDKVSELKNSKLNTCADCKKKK